MKKNTFILSCLFMMIGIVGVEAQPTSTPPDPTTLSYLVSPVYGFYGGTGALAMGSEHASVNLGTDSYGNISATMKTAGSYYGHYYLSGFSTVNTGTATTAWSKLNFQWYASSAGQTMKVDLCDSGWTNQKTVSTTSTTTGWNTATIAIGGAYNDISLFKFELPYNATNGNILPTYVNNIYFSRDAAPAPASGVTISSALLTDQYNIWDGTGASTFTESGTATTSTFSSNVVLYKPLAQTALFTFAGGADIIGSNRNVLHLSTYQMSGTTATFNVTITDINNQTATVSANATFGAWGSAFIKLNDFKALNGNIDLTAIKQISIVPNGDIYIDNIYTGIAQINMGPVARVRQGVGGTQVGSDYSSIKEAYDHILSTPSLTGAVAIEVFDDSKETDQITINLNDNNAKYSSLTIYPTGVARTVTYTGATGNLFEINNSATGKSATIEGRLGGSGDPNSLILQAPYITNRAVVSLNAAVNTTVQYCTFKGLAPDNRPRSTVQISSAAKTISIKGNHFDDCLLLDAHLPGSGLAKADVTTAGVILINGNPGQEGIVIDGNHFFEPTHSYFRSPIVRSYIYVDGSVCDVDNSIKIINNQIGGIGPNLTGILKIGNSTEGTAGNLLAINVSSGWPWSAPENNSRYILIEGNKIANIELYNRISGVYADNNDPIGLFNHFSGGFSGINIGDGLALVRDNEIHHIKLTSQPASSADQRLFFSGIYTYLSGGTARAIIENNDLYHFDVDYSVDDSAYSTLINGILCIIDNGGAEKVAATIRGNRILMGHMETHVISIYTDIHGISTRVQNMKSDVCETQLDVYNNIVVLNECKYTGALRNISPIDVINTAETNKGVINLYNNIIAVIPTDANAFDGVTGLVTGIHYASGKETGDVQNSLGITNIFHNSVYLKDFSAGTLPTAAINMEFRNTATGGLFVWNNNFINTLTNAEASVYYSNSPYPSNGPSAVSFDYNNYYIEANGNMYRSDKDIDGHFGTFTIKTFDNWKFSNLLPYLDNTTEHDHHSRFLDPSFNATATLDDFNSSPLLATITINNIDDLKTLLTPKRFIAGRKTDVAALGLKIINTTPGSSAVSVAAMTDATNMDNGTVAAKRRTNLPTVGAINTSFTNYLAPGGVYPIIPNISKANPWERDIVFADNFTGSYTMQSDLSVHDIYNDTGSILTVGANTLTITGYVGQEGTGRINAISADAIVVYNGDDGHATDDGRKSAAAQHIFEGTFTGNSISNLRLNNQSQYFVLLHGAKPWNKVEPAGNTLNVMRDFAIVNPEDTEIFYPLTAWLPKGIHPGGLNCTWYNTTLTFTATSAIGNHPKEASITTPYDYRPYAGQRIPRHAIYNDSVYNLTSASDKLISYHDYLYVKKDLSISASGKSFEIAADKYVKVDGSTTNNGGVAGLVIKSREVGTTETGLDSYLFPVLPRPNATFIYSTSYNSNATIDATVEMFSPAEYAPNDFLSPGKNIYEYRWQYFGTPVEGLSSAVGNGSTVYKYRPEGDNNLDGNGSGSPYWTDPSGNFIVGDGYCIYNEENKVYEWKGKLISANQTKSLAYKVSPITDTQINNTWKDFFRADGGHLLANPYTAAIDITKMDLTGTDATIYLYNTGTYTDYAYTGTSATTYNVQPGKTISVPQGHAGTKVDLSETTYFYLPRFIPSMQAFTVNFPENSTTTSTATVGFTYNAAGGNIGKNDVTQRSAALKPEMSAMQVDLKRDGYSDWTLLFTHPDCKKGFDLGWDGRTTPDENLPLSIFTIEEEAGVKLENSYYQISTVDNFDGVYLGILVNNDMRPADKEETGNPAKYELVFNHKLEGTALQLEDLLLKKTVDISEPGASYTFTEPNSGEIQKRFRISLRNTTDIPAELTTQTSRVYSYGKIIMIEHPAETGTIWIYDVAGKCVLTTNLATDNQTRLDTDLHPGVYLVKVIIGGKTINARIILK